MAQLTFEQRQRKMQQLQEINATLNRIQEFLTTYNNLSVNEWKLIFPNTEIEKSLDDGEKNLFYGTWEKLTTKLGKEVQVLIG